MGTEVEPIESSFEPRSQSYTTRVKDGTSPMLLAVGRAWPIFSASLMPRTCLILVSHEGDRFFFFTEVFPTTRPLNRTLTYGSDFFFLPNMLLSLATRLLASWMVSVTP